MIGIRSRTSDRKTEKFLRNLQRGNQFKDLERYGQMGVDALASATPRDSGETAQSWTYEITRSRGSTKIEWINTNVNGTANVAILLQYGHGTGTGGYVQGYDYINPALRPIFDRIANEVWKNVSTM